MANDTKPSNVATYLRIRLPLEIISSIIVLGLVWYGFRNTDFALVWHHLQAQIGPMVFVSLALSFAVFIVHGFRLSGLIERGVLPSFYIVNLGALLNSVLPFRIGDLARIYFSRKYFNVSGITLLAAALVEKFLDLTAVGLLLLVALVGGAQRFLPSGLMVSLAVIFLAIIAGYFLVVHSGLVTWVAGRLPFGIHKHVHALRQQLAVKNARRLVAVTVVIWCLNLLCAWAVFWPLLPDAGLGLYDFASLTVITALAVAIPGAPAGIGIFEAGVVAYLVQAHQVNYEQALASALIFHAIIVFPPVFGLLLGIVRRGR